MGIRRFVVALLGLGLFVAAALAAPPAGRGPSTPEERNQVLTLVELLETKPWTKEAEDARAWLLAFLMEVPDITVELCIRPLGSDKELKGVPPELQIQQAFSQASFLIRNPDQKAASLAVYVAGVQGAIRAYDSMKAAGKVDALPAFEDLKKLEASGELEKAIKKRIKQC